MSLYLPVKLQYPEVVTTQKVEAHSGENIDCLIKLLLNSSCKGGII